MLFVLSLLADIFAHIGLYGLAAKHLSPKTSIPVRQIVGVYTDVVLGWVLNKPYRLNFAKFIQTALQTRYIPSITRRHWKECYFKPHGLRLPERLAKKE